jgi:hypothetical protein
LFRIVAGGVRDWERIGEGERSRGSVRRPATGAR